jgi:anti-anti-sigma factor
MAAESDPSPDPVTSQWFRVVREDAVSVVELTLPLAIDNADLDRLNEQMLTLFSGQAAARWVLDLSGVSYMGSAMLGLMVNVRQRVKQAGGRLVLCALSPSLLQIFQTCSLERLFTIARNRAEAMQAAK